MIPEFVDGVNLEHGAHRCTMDEVRARFGMGPREKLFNSLEHLLDMARRCGFLYALIGGSFATAKLEPDDLDITWFGPSGMDKSNVPCECVSLMESEYARDRFGHDLMFIPLPEQADKQLEQMERFGRDLGFDVKTMTNRGTLLLELT